MSGTIIGEIRSAMIVFLNGISGLLSPSAAKVPRNVEMSVAKTAIKKLFCTALCHESSAKEFAVPLGAVACRIEGKHFRREGEVGKLVEAQRDDDRRSGPIRKMKISTQIVRNE